MENSTTTESKIVGIDVVELAVTCAAAALIMVAIGILLYYCCTTASQRERRYRKCVKTQTVEQSQTTPAMAS